MQSQRIYCNLFGAELHLFTIDTSLMEALGAIKENFCFWKRNDENELKNGVTTLFFRKIRENQNFEENG